MAGGWGGSLEGLEKTLCLNPTPSFPLINSHLAINTNVIKNSGFYV